MRGVVAPEVLQSVLLLLVCGAAAACDVRTGRIPNALTVSALGAGLLLAAVRGGGELVGHAATAGVLLALCLPLFAAGALGGGDLKLLVAVGALLGPGAMPLALLLTCAAGVALALLQSVRQGVLLPVLLDARAALTHWATFGLRGQAPAAIGHGGVTVPYGVAIAVGAVAAGLL
jgi:prepilin peptidase CpaA